MSVGRVVAIDRGRVGAASVCVVQAQATPVRTRKAVLQAPVSPAVPRLLCPLHSSRRGPTAVRALSRCGIGDTVIVIVFGIPAAAEDRRQSCSTLCLIGSPATHHTTSLSFFTTSALVTVVLIMMRQVHSEGRAGVAVLPQIQRVASLAVVGKHVPCVPEEGEVVMKYL